MPDLDYVRGGLDIQTGTPVTVKIPPRVFRGRLTGLLFDTDKTFLLPSAMHGIRGLKRFFDRHPGLEVLVVGHTDRQGGPEHNLRLSEERARSIAAYLQDDVDFWMQYYPPGRPNCHAWGTKEDQQMLATLSDDAGPFYTGPIDGDAGSGTKAGLRRFQKSKGLAESGTADKQTRRALVDAYMHLPDTSLPPGTPVLTHGCGEFHNEVPTPDGVAEQRNRRVEVFFFDGEVDPKPQTPCPSPGCKEQPEWVRRTVTTFDLDHEPGNLTVRVNQKGGGSLQGAQVHISGPTSDDGPPSDKDGLVRFEDLIPGGYSIFAHQEGFLDGSAAAVVAPGPETAPSGSDKVGAGESPPTPVELQANAGDVTVTVRSGSETGPAVPGATVSLQPQSGGAPIEKPTDGSGKANFPGVPPGKAIATVQAKGFNPAQEELTVGTGVATGKTIALKAAPATLVVKVVDPNVAPPALPKPVAGATVRVLAAGATSEQSKKTKDSSDKAHEGEASFENLPAGKADIRVQADGFALAQAQAQLTAGATTSLEVRLQASTGTVVAVVTDDLGAAVDDKDVIVTLQPPGKVKALTAPTVKGKAQFDNVPLGQSKIIASKPGFADGEATADVKAQQTVQAPVQLKRQLGQLTVTVVTPSGDLLQDAAVVLEQGKDQRKAQTNASGEAPYKDVPAGKWKLSASLDNFASPAPAEIEVKAAPGQKQTVTLTPNAVTPEIDPAPLVVVLKKHGCQPKRTKVRLRIKTGTFTGKDSGGRLTRSKDTVKFFTTDGSDPKKDQEITNSARNEFTAAQLTAGVDVFAEGAAVSTAQQDTDLHLDLFVGKNAFGKGVVGKATCVELKLDLFQSRSSRADPAPVAANPKTDRGRFLHVQDPGFHHGRAWLVVREVQPAGFAQNLQLQVVPLAAGAAAPGAVQLFRAEVHPAAPAVEAAVALPLPITPADLNGAPQVAGSKGVALFVEGQTPSNGLRDVQLQLGIQGGEADGDRAAFTVVRFTNLQATIPSTQALVNRTANGFTNTPVQNTVVRRATGAIASADFDESYVANVPIVMVENSLPAGASVQLQVTVQPANTPVSWSRLRDTRPAAAAEGGGDANGVINPVPAPANPRPTLNPVAGTPTIAKANLQVDSVGSFRVRAFVDENGSNEFDRDPATADSFAPEPYILMNFVLVRAIGVNNLSRANNGPNLVLQSAAGGPPTGNANVVSSTGNMTAGPNAGVWARAVVNVIGGGSDGLRGLNRLFTGWIQEITPTAGSTAPGGNTLHWGADYQLTVPNPAGGPGIVQTHHQFLVAAQEPQGTFLPPPAPQPHRMSMPMLDVTPFANAGMGGILPSGMGAVGPNALNKVAIPPAAPGGAAPPGQQWTVEMWDPPGIAGFPARHPAFPTAQMIAYRFNVDFQHDLCFFTNNQAAAGALGQPTVAGAVPPTGISGPGVGPPDPACCLYASVYTNTWTVRLSLTFALAAPFAMTVVTAFATALVPDAAASRIARPVQNLEVRFPPAVNRLSFDATT